MCAYYAWLFLQESLFYACVYYTRKHVIWMKIQKLTIKSLPYVSLVVFCSSPSKFSPLVMVVSLVLCPRCAVWCPVQPLQLLTWLFLICFSLDFICSSHDCSSDDIEDFSEESISSSFFAVILFLSSCFGLSK